MVKIHHIHQTASLFLFPNAFTTKRPILSPRSLQFSFKSFQSSSTRLMALVSIPEAIAAHSRDDSIFVDGSWHMPNTRNARDEFRRGPRIVGARYFDIDTVCTANTKNLPHMKPSGHQFSVAMDILNITPGNTLYVYANNGCGFAHRAYWTLSSFHDPSKVKLVQGSLEEWKSNGGALDDAELDEDDERMIRMPKDWQQRTPKYKCRQVDNTVDMDQMLDFVTERTGAVIVDARSHGRFVGKDPEPRPGLRGGHMPNALNVPFVSLLDDNDMTKFKPLDQVKEKFIEAGIKPIEESSNDERKVVCSCGSGVTAAALAVGLVECGLREKEDVYIYDGSWIEWGGDDNTPID
ncbi:hypothetical protein ACHAWO_010207 [Cyclotella atomus]|uniref:Sulfurtransferase n=1 Tax=Cyclotella atomus TaxID=382360 RepID=A0ABD3Q1K6_9STRA